jgi:hypothetical protein
MTRIHHAVAAGAIAVGLSALAPLGALGQATQTPQTPAAPQQASPLDTAALGALNRMGDYLNTLEVFQITGEITTEKVLQDGQKIERQAKVDVIADRPNRFRANVTDDRSERWLVYDGFKFTLYAPRLRYFTQIDAPPNLDMLADTLEQRFHMELPLVDLFRWGTDRSDFRNITHATVVGPSQINGMTVEQYAFRQEGMDWQIWIQQGDFPLPRKLVLTTMTDDARPQHSVVYDWNLAPSFNNAAFVFVAPAGVQEIPIAQVTAAAETGR